MYAAFLSGSSDEVAKSELQPGVFGMGSLEGSENIH